MSKPSFDDEVSELKRAKINLETAQVSWREIERFFAQGSLISVDSSLDLVEVAHAVSDDDVEKIGEYQNKGWVHAVTTEQAKAWQLADAALWAVVVRPLVLVQNKA
ncbi:MAG: hypothetical protein ACI9J2_001108 [Saprospiraceae bacterium]|jgi:hypothetical protein